MKVFLTIMVKFAETEQDCVTEWTRNTLIGSQQRGYPFVNTTYFKRTSVLLSRVPLPMAGMLQTAPSTPPQSLGPSP